MVEGTLELNHIEAGGFGAVCYWARLSFFLIHVEM